LPADLKESGSTRFRTIRLAIEKVLSPNLVEYNKAIVKIYHSLFHHAVKKREAPKVQVVSGAPGPFRVTDRHLLPLPLIWRLTVAARRN